MRFKLILRQSEILPPISPPAGTRRDYGGASQTLEARHALCPPRLWIRQSRWENPLSEPDRDGGARPTEPREQRARSPLLPMFSK